MKITPFHLLVVMLAGWLNSEQQKANDYLKEENKILRELLGGTLRPDAPVAASAEPSAPSE